MRLKIIGVIILIFIILFAVYEIAPAQPTHKIQYGTNINEFTFYQASLLKKAGITWIRSDYDVPGWNQILGIAEYYNISVLGIFDYASLPNGFTYQNWNATIQYATTTYPQVAAWEIWNEPDQPNFYYGIQNGSAQQYFTLLKYAYAIIHKNDPKAQVIALGGYDIPANTSQLNWVNTLFSLGISNYSTAISLHLYPGYFSSEPAPAILAYQTLIDYIKTKTSEPIWITETGTTVDQSTYITEAYTAFIKEGITHIFWYNSQDNSPTNVSQQFGLLNYYGVPKPSYYTLQNFTREYP
jgi:hypothetical protein